MSNKTIKLNVKLRAFTRGIIPNSSTFVQDAPNDGKAYIRENGEWKPLIQSLKANEVIVEEDSGLVKETVSEDGSQIKLRTNVWHGYARDLPKILDKNTTYYVIEDTIPNFYLDGGTAYSDENGEYDLEWSYGDAFTKDEDYDIVGIFMNAKGEFIYEIN